MGISIFCARNLLPLGCRDTRPRVSADTPKECPYAILNAGAMGFAPIRA